MSVLSHLEPQPLFNIFEQLAAIPHGSGDTKAISDWCVAFAKERGLRCRQDESNNLVIFKDATPGYESAPTVILQGHLDMVCARDEACAKDMEKEGLDLFVEGDLIGAKGTSLGGDDGIAVAMALAILDADNIPHPPLEVVLTVDEEIGLLGAASMDTSDLKGRIFLNVDSEVEGILTVSCAGGSRNTITLPIAREAFAGEVLHIAITGLHGGHSGQEIDKGRANANVLLGRVLRAMAKVCELRLVSVEGGEKDNAITRMAYATVQVSDAAAAEKAAADIAERIKSEYRVNDPEISIVLSAAEPELLPMDEDSSRRVITLLTCVPNGVVSMSADIAGLVQTSLNFGILRMDEKSVTATFSVRSSVDSEKQMVKDRLLCLTETLGGSVDFRGEYPAWEYRADSPLRELMIEVYREQYGEEPKVEAIHAGLECGIFSGKLPGLDCVSYGPDMMDIHTAKERLSISSTRRVFNYTAEILKRIR